MLVRKLLLKLLGFARYLRVISYVFLATWRFRIYLPAHKQVRFLEQLVKPGDVCIDIGANLGYFAVPLSRITGPGGKVYAVEPVATFRKVLMQNLARFALPNSEVLPYALGDADEKVIELATPEVEGIVRHGRTEIVTEITTGSTAFTHQATMMRPQTLFGGLSRLDYIKCDVEGYELHIVPHLLELLRKYRPVIEIEIDPEENKRQIIDMLAPLGYVPCFLASEGLQRFNLQQTAHLKEIELYFLPPARVAELAV